MDLVGLDSFDEGTAQFILLKFKHLFPFLLLSPRRHPREPTPRPVRGHFRFLVPMTSATSHWVCSTAGECTSHTPKTETQGNSANSTFTDSRQTLKPSALPTNLNFLPGV